VIRHQGLDLGKILITVGIVAMVMLSGGAGCGIGRIALQRHRHERDHGERRGLGAISSVISGEMNGQPDAGQRLQGHLCRGGDSWAWPMTSASAMA
jgi:hypothetical protein